MLNSKFNQKKEVDVLSFINKEDTTEGFEAITRETMAIPFVRILQKGSPQIDRNKSEYIPEATEGEFFNTVTKEVYGEKIKLIVLKFERIYIEWRPLRGGFVGYHTIENAERIAADKTFGAWKTEDGNILQENYVYLSLIVGHEQEGICVLSLSSTMIKPAREWNRLLTTQIMDNGKRAFPYYMIWKLSSELDGYINEKQYKIIGPERKALPERQVDYSQLSTPEEEEEKESY